MYTPVNMGFWFFWTIAKFHTALSLNSPLICFLKEWIKHKLMIMDSTQSVLVIKRSWDSRWNSCCFSNDRIPSYLKKPF